jgi:hypothetical protein
MYPVAVAYHRVNMHVLVDWAFVCATLPNRNESQRLCPAVWTAQLLLCGCMRIRQVRLLQPLASYCTRAADCYCLS